MRERVNKAFALIGKDDESQTAEIINLVASYLIYLKNFNLQWLTININDNKY